MFSNDYFLEENQEKLYNWDMDQNSIFSSTKEDLPYYNLFDNSSDKHYLLLNSFSDHGTTDSIGKYQKDEYKHPNIYAEDSLKAKKKIFKVKKYVEYDEILKEIYTEGEENNEEISKTKNKLLNRKRFTLKKKEENFVKLSQKEKVEKLSKLSKLVKRYRRKYTCLQGKIKNNITKIFQKYLYEKLKINYKNKYLNHNLNLDLYQLIKTLRRLHNINNSEYSDQKNVLENLINLIADNKLPFDSINFKKICTQIRLFLPKEKIKYINKKGSQITIQFPQKEVKITKKEYETYHKYINNNDVLRQIFGMEKSVTIHTNPSNSNNFQLIPIITLPSINLPFQDIIPNGKHAFLVLNGKNVSLGGNEVKENVVYNKNLSNEKNDNLKEESSIIQFPIQNDSHKNLSNPIYLIAAKEHNWEQ